MPPKIITLGNKKGGIPTNSLLDKGPKPILPNAYNVGPIKTEILTDTELQPVVNAFEISKLRALADSEEKKMTKFSIDKVEFCILNQEILNKLKVVNVSSHIRSDNIDSLIKAGRFGMKAYQNPSCHKTEDGRYYADLIAEPSQSVTSYTEMGTTNQNKLCDTCYKTAQDCPGHLGEITLNQAFVHPLFRDYLVKVLSCVCNTCSEILIKEEQLIQQGIDKLSGKSRLSAIYDIAKEDRVMCRNKKCKFKLQYKQNQQPTPENYRIKYRLARGLNKEYKDQDINETIRIVSTISEKDAQLLGFKNGAHPKDMIMRSMPVIPPVARPYTVRDGEVKEDHLTTAYDEIIRDNYKYALVENPSRKENIERDLYFHISHFIDNSDNKYCRSLNEKIHGIKQRIGKKEGLIRTNIMGKRVNFCGRSVLGPCSELKFGEVAVPDVMSKVLTVPIKVHEKNLAYAKKLWDDRKVAAFYLVSDGQKDNRCRVIEKHYTNLFNGQKITPKVGYTLERYMTDGDVVLVNRQPTLYKYSMIGNFVKLMPRKTIGIHMTETEMRNADFDGDEVNIHVIQSLDARVEAMTFANVQDNIPNALRNSAMIGMFYNSLSSAYIMTREPETSAKIIAEFPNYPKHEVERLSSSLNLTPTQVAQAHSILSYKEDLPTLAKRLAKHKIDPLSGHALFSSILPANFEYSKGSVLITDGVLVKGRISKDHIKTGKDTIQMSIWKWYGRDRACAFITDCVYLTDWFINQYGLTVGFDDICPSGKLLEDITIEKLKVMNELNNAILTIGPEKPEMTQVAREYREQTIVGRLASSKMAINSTIASVKLSPENPLNIMAKSGAKGKEENTVNILGMIGQQIVYDKRPVAKISDGMRCLPYFEYKSENIRSRGFIPESYLEGVSPSAMYFISESARQGGVSIAVNTGKSGSLYRKLVKVFEDYKVAYDGSVRNANDTIFQLGYLDGYDGGELINTNTPSSGELINFINIKEAAARINAEFS